MRWHAAAALTFSNGKTYIINRSSLCGKNEKKITNAKPGTVKIRTLESHSIPNGTRR